MPNQNYQRNRRLRFFAGPNGSGKSTILNQIDSKYDIGYYLNADILEQQLSDIGYIDLSKFGIKEYGKSQFSNFVNSHSILRKAKNDGYVIDIQLEKNKIINPDKVTHSYEASLISDVIRHKLLSLGKKITFETVMSHKSKLDFLDKSQKSGYKNYLYYISTESPIINMERVNQRVQMGGHPVSPTKIKSRYYNSLELLKSAVQYTHRTFIFDNSGDKAQLILEIYKGEEIKYHFSEIPRWVDNYLLMKNKS